MADMKQFLYHVMTNLFVAYVPVAFVMLIIYGGDVISHYDDEQCTIDFLNKHDVNRDHIYAILFATLGSYSIANKIYKTPEKNQFLGSFTFFFGSSVILSYAVLIMTLYGVLTAHCSATPDDNSLNGEVYMIDIYSGVLLTLMLSFAVNNMGILSHFEKDDSLGPRIVIGYTNTLILTSWVIRIIFSAFLLQMMTSDSFMEDSGNKDKLLSSQCIASVQKVDTESQRYKLYEAIELGKVNKDEIDVNERMRTLLYVILAALGTEAALRGLEVMSRYTKTEMYEEYTKTFLFAPKILALFTEICLALFVYTLTLSNDIAACPLLDPNKGTVQNVYWSSVTYVVFGFAMAAFREYRRYETMDKDQIESQGKTADTMGGMYSHFGM